MKERYSRRFFSIELFLLITLLLASCGTPTVPQGSPTSGATKAPEATPTEAPQLATTPLQPAKVELYLPSYLEPIPPSIQDQVNRFMNANPGVEVVIGYIDPQKILAMIAAGTPPSMAALDFNEVVNYAKQGWLVPLEVPAYWSNFLDVVVQSNTVNEKVYAYPWYHYSCFPNYLNLAIFDNNPTEVIAAARSLGAFLVSQENQASNLNLNWYPTLRKFYESGQLTCASFGIPLPLDPSLEDQKNMDANQQSGNFKEKYGIQLDPTRAAGLQASYMGGESLTLASVAVPAVDNKQYYTDRSKVERQVIGSFSVEDTRIAGFTKLNTGMYMIACNPEKNDCLAVDLNQEEIQLDGLYAAKLPVIDTPIVGYEQGSLVICAYYRNVQYCIKIF